METPFLLSFVPFRGRLSRGILPRDRGEVFFSQSEMVPCRVSFTALC